jgi:hypothetical protein
MSRSSHNGNMADGAVDKADANSTPATTHAEVADGQQLDTSGSPQNAQDHLTDHAHPFGRTRAKSAKLAQMANSLLGRNKASLGQTRRRSSGNPKFVANAGLNEQVPAAASTTWDLAQAIHLDDPLLVLALLDAWQGIDLAESSADSNSDLNSDQTSTEEVAVKEIDVMLRQRIAEYGGDNIAHLVLVVASAANRIRIVQWQLSHVCVNELAESNASVHYDASLEVASENGHATVVEVLLADQRVDPSARGNVALHRASANGHVTVVEMRSWRTRGLIHPQVTTTR